MGRRGRHTWHKPVEPTFNTYNPFWYNPHNKRTLIRIHGKATTWA